VPAVSVVVPFHNRVAWAVEAVRSVLEGTFEDFEVVLVDDGSTEDVAPLRRLGDGRVRYVRQENKGASAARNLGLELARGHYVAFLDSDDVFEPEKLERQVALMDRHPDVSISHTSYRLMSRDGEEVGEVPSGRVSGKAYPEVYFSVTIATPTVVIRRGAVGPATRFEEHVWPGEDVIFWARLLRGSEILGIDEPLSRVRVHGQNAGMSLDALEKGMFNIMRYGVERDEALSYVARRWSISMLYLNLAYIRMRKREVTGTLGYIVRALIAWPFNYRLYGSLALFPYKSFVKLTKRGKGRYGFLR
jgi:glycosyltransferase involved in cell wall biosynthesis